MRNRNRPLGQNVFEALLLDGAGVAARMAARAGLAALDSVLSDVENAAVNVEQRVRKGRRKTREIAGKLGKKKKNDQRDDP